MADSQAPILQGFAPCTLPGYDHFLAAKCHSLRAREEVRPFPFFICLPLTSCTGLVFQSPTAFQLAANTPDRQ